MKSIITLLLINLFIASNSKAQTYPLFVFNNGVADEKYNTPEKQVSLLKTLGYDGMEKNGLDNFDSLQTELDKQGLQLFTIYVNLNLDPNKPHYDARLPATIQKLKGRNTMLWINVTSRDKTYPPSSTTGDTVAIRLMREIADMAQTSGIKIMLYPHIWFWLEDFEHGLNLVKQINRKNVGITFNLPHYLAMTKPKDIEKIPVLLKKAKPYLFAVSICGATHLEEKDPKTIWNSLIQPLGQGTFDNSIIIKTLKEIGFNGPIGLQCYNIKGDKYEILKTSMEGWKRIK